MCSAEFASPGFTWLRFGLQILSLLDFVKMPSWWGKSSSKEPKKQQQKSKDGMRLQIGGWKSRLSSWTDEDRSGRNSCSPGYRSSSDNSHPVSPCTSGVDSAARQPWPLPCSPFSPQGADNATQAPRKLLSLPLPSPQEVELRTGAEICATSASSSLSSAGSSDEPCDTNHTGRHVLHQQPASARYSAKECRSQAIGTSPSSPVSLKAPPLPAAAVDRSPSPCFSPCRSPRAILDAGEAFPPAFTNSGVDKSPNLSPIRSPRLGFSPKLQSGSVSPRHTLHPLPSPPASSSMMFPPLSPTSRCDTVTRPTTPCWQKGKLIGTGTFGNVFVGFDSNNIGRMCAMKEVLIIGGDGQSESAKQLGQEIALLSRLRHQNIVQYYGSESLADKLYIYLEYVSGGSIHKLLQDYGPFKESVIRSYARQILCGLSYLHCMDTVHRDIKGANILVDTNGIVKLADFGMAKNITAQSFALSFKGSPYWMAPEVIKSTHGYDLSVDIWSLGCTVIEMATGRPPWSEYEGVAVVFKIGNSREIPAVPDFLSEEGQHFLRLCLQRNPADRPTAAQLMEHPFVVNVQEGNADHLAQLPSDSLPRSPRHLPFRMPSAPMTVSSMQTGVHPLRASSTDAFFDIRKNRYGEQAQNQNNGMSLFNVSQFPGVYSDVHQQRLASCLDLKC